MMASCMGLHHHSLARGRGRGFHISRAGILGAPVSNLRRRWWNSMWHVLVLALSFLQNHCHVSPLHFPSLSLEPTYLQVMRENQTCCNSPEIQDFKRRKNYITTEMGAYEQVTFSCTGSPPQLCSNQQRRTYH